jgi:hypothetical protein
MPIKWALATQSVLKIAELKHFLRKFKTKTCILSSTDLYLL